MQEQDIRIIECRLLVDAIYQRWGYDFRQYQFASLCNRFEEHAKTHGYRTIAEIVPAIMRCRNNFSQLLFDISVTVTRMFRDPLTNVSLQKRVFPVLKTYPHLNIWHAGCATGEEAYSMAILLHESDLLSRAQIYATDINDRSLEHCKKGIYPISDLRESQSEYMRAGGMYSFSDYYHTCYGVAKMNEWLHKHIVFSNHNLVVDGVFSEMHLIVCKNVLIYFNRELQNRVLSLFTDSLCRNGYLCLGEHESLDLTPLRDRYELIDPDYKIYRKVAT